MRRLSRPVSPSAQLRLERADDGGEEETEPEDEPEVVNTVREIDTWLEDLAGATISRDRRGIAICHELLTDARPHDLVDERVENALLNQVNAYVRIQFFARSDVSDLDIEVVRVSGWKRRGQTISLAYVPGS